MNSETNNLDELLKALGYEKDENAECKFTVDRTGGVASNCCQDFDSDLLFGFQDVNPVLFITIGEIFGDILAGQLPFNVAISISNFLNLVGQIIETYGAQLQYYAIGPGRYYSPGLRNVSNPYCSCTDVSSRKIERLEDIVSNLISQSIKDKQKINELEDKIKEIVMKNE